MESSKSWLALVLAMLAGLGFLLALGRGPIATSHEARVAATALTMADSGLPWSARAVSVKLKGPATPRATAPAGTLTVNPWVVPVYEGHIRLEKPPLPYWGTAASYLLVERGETGARLITAVMGIIATWLVYLLAKELCGWRTAFWAAAFWVSTFFVVDEYRKVMSDPYLAFFTLLGVVAWVKLCRGREASRLLPALGFYLILALGLLSKGPVVLLLLAVPMVLFGVIYGRRPRLGWMPHVLGVALVLLLTLPWPLYMLARIPNLMELWRFESVGEFSDNQINARGWYFYIGSFFQIALPWTPVFVAGVTIALMGRRSPTLPEATARSEGETALVPHRAKQNWFFTRRSRGAFFALLWCVLVSLFFSLAYVKKNAYLLPLMPACAILSGRAMALAIAWNRRRLSSRWPEWLLGFQQIIGMGMGLAVAALLLGGTSADIQAAWKSRALMQLAGERLPQFGVLALIAVVVGMVPMLPWSRRSMARGFFVQACAFSVLVALMAGFIESEKDIRRGADLEYTPGQHAPGHRRQAMARPEAPRQVAGARAGAAD